MKRSADSPAFFVFSLILGLAGIGALLASTEPMPTGSIPAVLLLAALALAMRLNTFTIPPNIVVSLVYTVQLAAIVLFGGAVAAWLSVATFILSILARWPSGVRWNVITAVVSFNVGMDAMMCLVAAAVYRVEVLGTTAGGSLADFLLTPKGLIAVLVPAIILKAVNEALMTIGSYLRGVSVRAYLQGARRVAAVEAGMLPLALLLALVGATMGARGLAVATFVMIFASVIVKRLSDTRTALHLANVRLERRVGELDVLGRVGRAISSTIEIGEVLEAILLHCSKLVDTGNFFIALVDREAGQLDIAVCTERGERLPRQRIRLGEGLTSLVIQKREAVLIGDLEAEAAALAIKPIFTTEFRTRSWLGVPLAAGDEVVGVMTVQDERPNVYDEETVRVFSTIAAQAAISIQNAQLVQRTIDQTRLKQENEDLRLINQRKNEFVNMVAHQLQAPLTAIIGFSDLIRRASMIPQAEEYIGLIHRESCRLSELVEQLLSLSRIRSGRITPSLQRIDLNAIARAVVDSQVLLIREREVAVDVGLGTEGLPIDADPVLIHQAVANLVNNAVKYSPTHSTVAIRTERIDQSGHAAGPFAVLSVRDSGPGVSDADREKIFDEFYRAQSPATLHVKGSGLGLTIAKEIVHIHGGRLGVEAAPGGGSVFFLAIPAV